jgi:hypothetical protein
MKRILTFVLILFASTVTAQWTNNPLFNTIVRDSIGLEESVPLQATTPDGKTWVSYFALYGGGYQMFVQLLDSAGNKLFGNAGLLVSNNPQSTAIFRYDLKSDNNGNAILAFQDTRTGGDLHVVAYKISQQGNQLWGNNGIQLIDPQSDQGISPTIGFTQNGNIVFSWNASNSTGQWVAAKMVDQAGSNMWPSYLQIKDPAGVKRYGRPTVAPCGADGFLMLYVETTGFGLGVSNMYAMRYDVNGNTVWSAPVHFSTNTISFFFFPKAVEDGLSGFYTAFTTGNPTNPAWSDVFVQHIDSSGNLWNATGNAASIQPGEQRFCVAAHREPFSGTFWVLIKTTDPNQNQSGVAVQSFDMQGNTQLTSIAPSIVSTSAAYNDPWDFTITNDGIIAFYVVGNFNTQTIQAMKCDFTGSLMWNGFPALICTKASEKDDLMAGLYSNGQTVLVWMDKRNDFGVYAQNVNNDGSIGVATAIQEYATSDISIWPNPFTDSFTFEKGASESCEMIITDMAGRIVYTETYSSYESKITVSLPTITRGMYIGVIRIAGVPSVFRLEKL